MPELPLTDRETSERLRGIGLVCIAVSIFSLLDSSAKFAGAHGIPTIEIAWLRYALSLVFGVALLRSWRRPGEYVTGRPYAHAIRALFLLGSTVLNFMAIRHLQLAETVSITFASPLIVTALAGPLLGEWTGPRRWAAVIVGFLGVIVIVKPEPDAFQPEALYSVGAAFCYAGYALTTRMLSATETPAGMLIYGSLLSAILLLLPLPWTGFVVPTDWRVIGALVVTGLAGAVGHYLLILGNRHAPATVLAPFSYTQLLSMIIAGYFIFGDIPDAATLIGAAIIISSGLYVLYRESVRGDR